ncbi:PC-esterase domain-containing protein 1B [Fukomys damarensis]|uniref:PC-esterase domain-containing protein 1B n=1 Tax=Fukomys damarensis TaxID=885580 RepID=UPI00053FA358|nr:PC-esterase domain-containing protein 1B [Fukomys damarensis]
MTHLRTCEVRRLLHNKFVVVMGDSIQRTVYKDLVLLLQKNCLLSPSQLKAKGELSFEHDVLLEGGRCGCMHNNIYYREVRQFCTGHHLVRFYFLTRAYSAYLEEVLSELRRGEYAPDLVVLNSCLWDISRHGRQFPTRYREDLECLFRRMDRVLPESCLLVWNTTLPVANTVSGGFLPPGALASLDHLSEEVIEANFYSSFEAAQRGFDLLDLHFYFRHADQHRLGDGVHWNERAHRRLSQLLLAHVADAWGVNLPGAFRRPEPPARFRSPRQPSKLFPPGPASFVLYPEGIPLPSDLLPQQPPNLSDSSRRRVEYIRGANSRAGLQPTSGPIRRVDTQHPHQVSSPYPIRLPAGSQERRRRRRRSSRRIQHTQSQE